MIYDCENRTIHIKIVFYGPSLSGKTTLLHYLFKAFKKQDQLLSLSNSIRRTLPFEYGIITLKGEEMKVKLHLYAAAGHEWYRCVRLLTLKEVDGVIFVADTPIERYPRNLNSWKELKDSLGKSFVSLPKVIAFNKQDLYEKFESRTFLDEISNSQLKNVKVTLTSATNGEGVIEMFKAILELILHKLKKKYIGENAYTDIKILIGDLELKG